MYNCGMKKPSETKTAQIKPWQRIREARKAKKLKQYELAAACGVTPMSVSLWEKDPENGGNTPSHHHATLLSQILGIPVDDVRPPTHIYDELVAETQELHELEQAWRESLIDSLKDERVTKGAGQRDDTTIRTIRAIHNLLRTHVHLVPWDDLAAYANHNSRKQVIQRSELIGCPLPWKKSLFAFRVSDSSMSRSSGANYPKDCIVFVDRARAEDSQIGDRVLALCIDPAKPAKNPATLFREYAHDTNGVYLRALNRKLKDYRGRFQILGKIVGTWVPE